jgi:hypothetical protein
MSYDSKFKRADIDELFKAILSLKDEEDCYRFLRTFAPSMKSMPLPSDFRLPSFSLKKDLQRN